MTESALRHYDIGDSYVTKVANVRRCHKALLFRVHSRNVSSVYAEVVNEIVALDWDLVSRYWLPRRMYD